MIIKNIDDKSNDLKILNDYLKNDKIPKEYKSKIELEIKKIQSGLKGEKESAYEINFTLSAKKNIVIIHDLRLEIDNQVAQIDHVIINRLFEFYICESKNLSGGVSINDNLEFTGFYNNKPYSLPSPIEQNNKHIIILKKIFGEIIELPKRLGMNIQPKYFNTVLISKNSRITHPNIKLPEKTKILKNDQFINYFLDIEKEGSSTLDIFKAVSYETIENLGKRLIELHSPIDFNWSSKFGIEKYIDNEKDIITSQNNNKKKYECIICNKELDKSVVFWCRKNKEKYENKLLCREHQPK